MKSVSALLGAVALMAGCHARVAGERGAEWDRDAVDAKEVIKEEAVALPSYPQDSDLLEFAVGPSGSHRYFVDGKTLAIGADGVVRYALVIRTAGGANDVSFEGIRCKTHEKRIYGVGQPSRVWLEARRSSWDPIVNGRANEYQAILYAEYFCPDRLAPAERSAVLRALRSGVSGASRNIRE